MGHVGALYGAFLAMMMAANCPPMLAALTLGYSASLFGSVRARGVCVGGGGELGGWAGAHARGAVVPQQQRLQPLCSLPANPTPSWRGARTWAHAHLRAHTHTRPLVPPPLLLQLTHYSSGSAAVYYGSGFMHMKEVLGLGAMMGVRTMVGGRRAGGWVGGCGEGPGRGRFMWPVDVQTG